MIAPLPPPVHGSAMMTQYIKDSGIINNAVEMDWVNLSTSRSLDEIGRKSIKNSSGLPHHICSHSGNCLFTDMTHAIWLSHAMASAFSKTPLLC